MENFKSLKYIYNTRTKRYTIYIDKANVIKNAIKSILGRSRTNLLILKDNNRQFDIYEFFLLDLEYMLETIKESYPDLAIKIGGIALNDLMEFLTTRTWLAERNVNHAVKVFNYSSIKAKMKYNLLPHQVEVFKKYEVIKNMSGLRGMALHLEAGMGKALANDTPVKTLVGWTPIGDLKIGDKVIGRDGKETTVVGVYPQGKRQLYKVTFEDGRWVNADEEHLWTVKSNGKEEVLTTAEIIKRKDNGDSFIIPLVKPQKSLYSIYEYEYDTERVIEKLGSDETILGVLEYFTDAPAVLKRDIAFRLNRIYKINKEDLDNVITILKFNNEGIANKVVEFLRSLGYIVSLIEDDGFIIEVFKGSGLKIKSIEEACIDEATCIEVDNEDKLFVVKDFIVTHNTMASLALGEALDYNNMIIVAPNNTLDDVWVKSVTEDLYKSRQPYFVMNSKNKDYKKERFLIMGYETLDKVIKDKKLMRSLKRLRPMLIVDEFHNFNNLDALRTNNLLTFVNSIDFKDIALLTGTPVKMDLKEMKPMLYILDKKFKPIVERYDKFYMGNLEMFRNRFEIYRKHIGKDTKSLPKIEIKEYRIPIPNSEQYTLETINREIDEFKTERLSEILSKMDLYEATFESLLNKVVMSLIEHGIGKTKANVMVKDYKKLIKNIRKHNANKKLYMIPNVILEAREMEKELIIPNLTPVDTKTFKDIRSIIKYPELKVLGEALGKILLGTRIRCYNDLAKNINYRNFFSLTNKKTIVFSNYVSTCRVVQQETVKQGYHPVGVYGELVEKLPVNVKKFNDLNDKTNPIVATYKSLSTGVPLVAANVILLLDIPVRNHILDQSISRAWRIGQDKPVIVFMMKLDTGDKFNITDRDHFILNLSTRNVEMITGNELPYDVPEQMLMSELEDEPETQDSEVVEDIKEEIISDMMTPLNKIVGNDVTGSDIDPSSFVGNIISKIDFKL